MAHAIVFFVVSAAMCIVSRQLIEHYRRKGKSRLVGSWVVVYMGSLIAMIVSLIVAIV